ncbi:MAG TPA: zf-HC2 domain-containing protein [bacterium]|nr:zf-HC2 domain-containing protein [bacterium]
MKCSTAQRHLLDYAEGLASAAARREIDRHLAACPRCAAELALLQKNIAALKRLPDVKAPAHLWANISRAVEELEQPPALALWFEEFVAGLRRHAVPAISFALIVIVSAILIAKGDLFRKSKLQVIDLQDGVSAEISLYITEHGSPDNAGIYQGEMADLSRALEEGV